MTIADDVKTVLSNQASLATVVQGIATKINNQTAGQTVDLSKELELLNSIKVDLEPTPAPSPAPTPAPETAPDAAPDATPETTPAA